MLFYRSYYGSFFCSYKIIWSIELRITQIIIWITKKWVKLYFNFFSPKWVYNFFFRLKKIMQQLVENEKKFFWAREGGKPRKPRNWLSPKSWIQIVENRLPEFQTPRIPFYQILGYPDGQNSIFSNTGFGRLTCNPEEYLLVLEK